MKSLVFVLGVILALGIITFTEAETTEAPMTFWQKISPIVEAIEKIKKTENDAISKILVGNQIKQIVQTS